MTKAELFIDFLADEGYRPKLDSDGDVTFKHEGKTYIIFAEEDDKTYVRLGALFIWSIDDEAERGRAHAVANEMNRAYKVVKVCVVEKDTYASVELFFADLAQFKAVFDRSLAALVHVVGEFQDGMRARIPASGAEA